MATVPRELFHAEQVDFDKLLLSSESLYDSIELDFCTLGGVRHTLGGFGSHTTVAEVRKHAAGLISAPAHSLKLLLDDRVLDSGSQTVADAGLVGKKLSITLLRCPADRSEVARLFAELVRAIEHHQEADARRLVDEGAGFDSDGNILRAGRHMHLPGDRIAKEDEPSNTMLHLALRQGFTNLALHLISKGVDVNARNDVGRTPLMMATLKNQSVVIDALLSVRAETSACDYLGNSALAYALKNGNDEVSARLVTLSGQDSSCSSWDLSRDPKLRATFWGLAPTKMSQMAALANRDDVLPVLTCCACGLPLTALALLRQGAGHEGVDEQGRTALHYAHDLDETHPAHTRASLLTSLVENGADTEAIDKFGFPPECGIRDLPADGIKREKCTPKWRLLWERKA